MQQEAALVVAGRPGSGELSGRLAVSLVPRCGIGGPRLETHGDACALEGLERDWGAVGEEASRGRVEARRRASVVMMVGWVGGGMTHLFVLGGLRQMSVPGGAVMVKVWLDIV